MAARSADVAECSESLPYVRRVHIVNVVAADVREQSAESAICINHRETKKREMKEGSVFNIGSL